LFAVAHGPLGPRLRLSAQPLGAAGADRV